MLEKIARRYESAGVMGLARALMRQVVPEQYRSRLLDPSPLPPVLAKIGRLPRFTIIQIGAYVGDSDNDPLVAFLRETLPKNPGGRVVLVEPVRTFFDRLKINYGNVPGVVFENVAIAEQNGEKTFYYLDADPVAYGHPEWMRQLSSLREDRMKERWEAHEANKELQEFYLQHRAETTVQCLTLKELTKKHQIETIDLLQIDAEGYDFEIIKTIDFRSMAPRHINFEHAILSKEDRDKCRSLLKQAGYRLMEWGTDTLAIKRSAS